MKRYSTLLLLIFVIAGCGDDDPGTTPPPATFDLPESPTELMAAFQSAYETMDLDLFRKILDPGFETILQQETIDEFPDVGETLDWNEETRIAERMFSGDDLADPNGAFVPGMAAISFGIFSPVDDWQQSQANDPIPDTLFAPYQVDFLFNRGQEYSQIHIKGQIRFYVAARDSLFEGETRQYYRMVGQVDLTSINKETESSTWGSVKAQYR